MTIRRFTRGPQKQEVHDRDLAAEAAVVAACLDPVDGKAAWGAVQRVLQPEHFYSPAHRRIYEAIDDLFRRDEKVDLLTVTHHLRAAERLREVGGSEYIAQVFESTPATVHVDRHAEIVINCWKRRELWRAADELSARLRIGEPLDELADRFGAQLERFTAKRSNGRLDIISPEAIFAELEAPSYLAHGILRQGSLTLLGGYGSSGKTWIAVALLVAVATGGKWLGRFACTQGRARFVDYESDAYEMRRRIQKVAHGLGIRDAISTLDLVSLPRMYLSQGDAEERFAEVAKGRTLLIIDSLRAASPGLDENDSRIREGLDRLRQVAKRTQCTIVVVVHAKKKKGEEIDTREVLRGSSAIFDAADTILTVDYRRNKPLLVEQPKGRLGVTVEPFGVTLRDTAFERGVLIEAGELPDDDSPLAAADKQTQLCRTIKLLLRRQPGQSKTQLRANVKGARCFRSMAAGGSGRRSAAGNAARRTRGRLARGHRGRPRPRDHRAVQDVRSHALAAVLRVARSRHHRSR
jgi:replicative DNA helicase